MYYVLHSGLIAKLYINYTQAYNLQISLEIGIQMYYVLHTDLIAKIYPNQTHTYILHIYREMNTQMYFVSHSGLYTQYTHRPISYTYSEK